MREKRTAQTSLFDPPAIDHPLADGLERASVWLDEHPELLDEIAADLGADTGAARGRHGLTCGRCWIIKRCVMGWANTFEGKRILTGCIDSTVTHTHILEPADSRLLYDGIRVLSRLLGTARKRLGPQVVVFHDHRRAAKRRTLEIGSRRGARRSKTYRKLLRLAQRTLGYAEGALPAVASAAPPWAVSWTQNVSETRELLLRVVDQTQRRVFDGETVPAAEKVLSLFEPHTDIILKGGRGTHFGHKVNFATGRSGLVLDTVVEKGNPADSARCLPMLERHIEHYGTAPTHAAFDGGYASRENLKQAKALGVTHAMFHKKRGMKETDMSPSPWVYRQLKRFRAGIEAGISYLKRCFGLGLCRWRGWPRFQAYVHSAVFAHNLMRLVRPPPRPA